jgi:hypothetical protein
MPTSQSNLPSFQGLTLFSSKNPSAKERYLSKNNMPLMKVSHLTERKPEEQAKPPSFNSEKLQEPEEEMTLRMKDTDKTTLIRSCFNIKKPPVTTKTTECSTHQPRGKFPLLKLRLLFQPSFFISPGSQGKKNHTK